MTEKRKRAACIGLFLSACVFETQAVEDFFRRAAIFLNFSLDVLCPVLYVQGLNWESHGVFSWVRLGTTSSNT
jgi:hypothetical protein